MSARQFIESAILKEAEGKTDTALGPPKTKEIDRVTIQISGEGAGQFREFMQGLAKVCNGGSSREIAIADPADARERALTWSFDGDGDTRIEVSDE